jgi:hypothetical protein
MISVPADVPRPLSLRWRRCLAAEVVLRESGFPIDLPGEPTCPEPTMLSEDEPYLVPGDESAMLVALIEMAASFGAFDPALFEQLLGSAGLVYIVDLEVLDANGTVIVSGYKRAAITTRMPPTTNPPDPTFRAGHVTIAAAERFRCVPTLGATAARFPPATDVELEPVFAREEELEEWLETFPIYDYTGSRIEGRENAYYTWFATAGSISEGTTQPPSRRTTWRTPEELGPQSLWLVIRDGHLGTSGCRVDVEIAAD